MVYGQNIGMRMFIVLTLSRNRKRAIANYLHTSRNCMSRRANTMKNWYLTPFSLNNNLNPDMLQRFNPKNEAIKVFVGDKIVPRADAKVSVFDSVVQGGDAVWEGLRVYKSGIFCLDKHL